MLPPAFDCIPRELVALPRWVTHKGKVPFDPGAVCRKASVSDPGTWGTFDAARLACEEGDRDGVGFVLNGDGVVGVDLDKCVHQGVPDPAALEVMERIGCEYIELSPSGTGLHGFGYGPHLVGTRGVFNGVKVELYSSGRYLTVTGHTVIDGPLVELPGFGEVSHAMKASSPTEEYGRITEDDGGHLLSSSVGIPAHTLPNSEGERNRRLFDLARWVKGKYPNATREQLRAIVVEWHCMALPVIGTKDFATTWTDFLRGLEKVRKPHGETLQAILETVDDATPLPEWIIALEYGEACHRLIRVCAALQAHAGCEPFFLSARQAGELIGMHFTDAAKVLGALVFDGVVTLVSKGAGRVASRYRMSAHVGLTGGASLQGGCVTN